MHVVEPEITPPGEGVPPEPLASAPGFLLSFAGRRMASRFAEALEPHGIQPRHFGVLNLLNADPGVTQHELGKRMLIDPSSMVAVIDELEEMGLAERRPHLGDRRKHALHLTAKGRRMLERARKVAFATAGEMFAALNADEVETLRRLLRRIVGVDR